MKKLMILLILIMIPIVYAACPDGISGAGTDADPCQIVDCNTELNTSGVYELQNNLSGGRCINITASDVEFRGAGYNLTGESWIIRSNGYNNITIHSFIPYGSIDVTGNGNLSLIYNNTFYGTGGITLVGNNSKIYDNSFLGDLGPEGYESAIYVVDTDNTNLSNIEIYNNTISLPDDDQGAFMMDLQANVINFSIYNNTLTTTDDLDILFYTVTLYPYSSTSIYNNLLNTSNTSAYLLDFIGNASSSWNTTSQSGGRIFGTGSHIGGNYYTTNTGTGFSDTCNPDWRGLCNSTFTLFPSNIDYLPLAIADTTNPEVNILYPTDDLMISDNTSITLNYTASDLNLQNCWYNLNNGSNTTLTTCQNTTFSSPDGEYILYLFANDSAMNNASDEVNISIDSTIPVFTHDPGNGYEHATYKTLEDIAFTLTETHLDSWFSNITYPNGTVLYSFTTYQGEFINISANNWTVAGTYLWESWANDTHGNEDNYTTTLLVFDNGISIELGTNETPEFGKNITLIATVTAYENVEVQECNFSLSTPSVTPFSDVNGTNNSGEWVSSGYLIAEEGVHNYNVTCLNEFGNTSTVNGTFNISYDLTYSPQTYQMSTVSAVDELKNVTVYMYDDSSSNVNYTITADIQNISNFTMTYPNSTLLTSTDNSTDPINFTFQLQADATMVNGTYEGNITLNNTLDSTLSYIYFNYTIGPPTGLPVFYSTGGVECSNIIGTTCSPILSIAQESSNTQNYVINNTGGALLTNCQLDHDTGLDVSWVSYPSVFNLSAGASLPVNVVLSPSISVATGSYAGSLYIQCDNTQSEPDNNPRHYVLVTSRVVGGGSTTTTIVESTTNVSEELTQLGICNNDGICQDSESYFSCPDDCAVSFETLFCTPLFNCGSWRQSWFVSWLAVMIAIMLLLFYYRKEQIGKLTRRFRI